MRHARSISTSLRVKSDLRSRTKIQGCSRPVSWSRLNETPCMQLPRLWSPPPYFLRLKRNPWHPIPEFRGPPAVFFTVDAPRRVASDVVYVNPEDAKIRPFVTHL